MNVPTMHLNIGEMIVAREPVTVSTILGSCVAVCLFSERHSVGGIIHFSLPEANGPVAEEDALRYGNMAIPALIEQVLSATGGDSSEISAKLVGGASEDRAGGPGKVGALNIEIAEKLLREYKINVVGSATGGSLGRKLLFHIPNGRLRVAKLGDQKIESTTSLVTQRSSEHTLVDAEARPRKVLIIDDSKTICEILKKIFDEDPKLTVVGTAANPIIAMKLIESLRPDVITLDIHMPEMDGITFLEQHLARFRLPVVMISSISLEEGGQVLRALELGAVDYIQKPSLAEIKNEKDGICEKVVAASYASVSIPTAVRPGPHKRSSQMLASGAREQIVAIGASTGGTEALRTVLTALPENIPPILIVQHIPAVFSTAFARRMNELCPFEVKEAADGDFVAPGRVLIAPGDFQMELKKSGAGFVVRVFPGDKVNRHRPSVDVLFDSVATLGKSRAVGVLLTGMGADGAKGLLRMRQAGARTIVQDEKTSIVFGMPKEAIRLGAAEFVRPLDEIAQQLVETLSKRLAS